MEIQKVIVLYFPVIQIRSAEFSSVPEKQLMGIILRGLCILRRGTRAERKAAAEPADVGKINFIIERKLMLSVDGVNSGPLVETEILVD